MCNDLGEEKTAHCNDSYCHAELVSASDLASKDCTIKRTSLKHPDKKFCPFIPNPVYV
jgi:hypothetical protein